MPNPASLRRSPTTKRVLRAVSPAAKVALGKVEPFRRPVDRDASPIFVCGCSHSGTTLLLRLVGQLPGVYAVPYESKIFATPKTRRTQVASLRGWLADAHREGKSRFCEKTPDHVFHLDRMLRCFPSARVLVMVRDGRDVAASLGRRWEGDVERGIRKWMDAVESCQAWTGETRVLVVRYEDLVRSPEPTMRAVCEHIREPYAPEATADKRFRYNDLEGTERPESVVGDDHRLHRAWQVNQPMFDGSGRWREDLTADQQELCHRLAGPLLVGQGYTDVPT